MVRDRLSNYVFTAILKTVDAANFDKNYIWGAKTFLKMMSIYLITNELVIDNFGKVYHFKISFFAKR